MRDLKNNIGVVQAIAPAVHTATVTGPALDLRGFNSAALVVSTGAIAGSGNFTLKVQDSDTTTAGDFVDVPADQLHGAFPASLAADTVLSVGYCGYKRYIRAVLTKNSGTNVAASVALVKGDASVRPVV